MADLAGPPHRPCRRQQARGRRGGSPAPQARKTRRRRSRSNRPKPTIPRAAKAEARIEKERQAALFFDRPGQRPAAAAPARRSQARRGRPARRRRPRIHLAPDRTQAGRLRRRRAQCVAAYPGPGGDALRNRAGHRRQGQPDRQLWPRTWRARCRWCRIRVVETIPGKILHGAGTAQSEAADRAPVRDPRLAGLHRHAFAADHGAGQGHLRPAGGGRPGQDAAPAGGRHHRIRQVGRHQRHDPVAAVQVRAARTCA